MANTETNLLKAITQLINYPCHYSKINDKNKCEALQVFKIVLLNTIASILTRLHYQKKLEGSNDPYFFNRYIMSNILYLCKKIPEHEDNCLTLANGTTIQLSNGKTIEQYVLECVAEADKHISTKTTELVAKYINDILTGRYNFVDGADLTKNKIYFIKYFINWFLQWKHTDPDNYETGKQINLFNRLMEKYGIDFYKEMDYGTLVGMIMEKEIDQNTIFELYMTFSP